MDPHEVAFAAAHPESVDAGGGELFVDVHAAGAFLDELERRGLRLLGMEGFMVAPGAATVPSMDQIADLSDASPTLALAEARALIETWTARPSAADHPALGGAGRHMIVFVVADPVS